MIVARRRRSPSASSSRGRSLNLSLLFVANASCLHLHHPYAAFAQVVRPDVPVGHAVSECTEAVSVRPGNGELELKLLLTKHYMLRAAGKERFCLHAEADVELDAADDRIRQLSITWEGCGAYATRPDVVPAWVGKLAAARRSAGLRIHDVVRLAADAASQRAEGDIAPDIAATATIRR